MTKLPFSEGERGDLTTLLHFSNNGKVWDCSHIYQSLILWVWWLTDIDHITCLSKEKGLGPVDIVWMAMATLAPIFFPIPSLLPVGLVMFTFSFLLVVWR